MYCSGKWVDKERGFAWGEGGGIWEIFASSSQFCYLKLFAVKTTLKNKVLFVWVLGGGFVLGFFVCSFFFFFGFLFQLVCNKEEKEMMKWIKAVWGQKRMTIFRWRFAWILIYRKTLMGQMRKSEGGNGDAALREVESNGKLLWNKIWFKTGVTGIK